MIAAYLRAAHSKAKRICINTASAIKLDLTNIIKAKVGCLCLFIYFDDTIYYLLYYEKQPIWDWNGMSHFVWQSTRTKSKFPLALNKCLPEEHFYHISCKHFLSLVEFSAPFTRIHNQIQHVNPWIHLPPLQSTWGSIVIIFPVWSTCGSLKTFSVFDPHVDPWIVTPTMWLLFYLIITTQ